MKHYSMRCRRLLRALHLGLLLVRASIFSALSGDTGPARASGTSANAAPQWSDEDVTLATVTAITQRATTVMGAEDTDHPLPHPLVTDANFGRHLGKASEAQQAVSAINTRHGVDLLLPGATTQTSLDDALIHCLHQLDHRTKQQDQRIMELEAKLADATRRLCSVEAERP